MPNGIQTIAKRLCVAAVFFCPYLASAQFCDVPGMVCDSRCDTSTFATSDTGLGTLFRWSRGPCETGGPDLDAPLVTDRPDFTEASSTVGRGVAQIELGYTYFYDEENGTTVKAHSYPETLLRYGMIRDWFELRVGTQFNHSIDGVTNSTYTEWAQSFTFGYSLSENVGAYTEYY